MNKKILYGVLGVVGISTIAYIIYRRSKKNKSKGTETISETPKKETLENKALKDSGDIKEIKETQPSNQINQETNLSIVDATRKQFQGNINFNERGIAHTEKRVTDFENMLKDLDVKNKELVRKDGTALLEPTKKWLYLTFFRNVDAIRKGINADKFNQETKNYGLGLLNNFENFYKRYFNPEKYSPKADWFIQDMKKITFTDFYK